MGNIMSTSESDPDDTDDKLKNQIDNLSKQLASFKTELDTMKTANDAEHAAIREQLKEHIADIAAHPKVAQNEETSAQLQALTDVVSNNTNKIESTEMVVQELSEAVQQLQKQHKTHATDMKKHAQKIEALEEAVAENKSKARALKDASDVIADGWQQLADDERKQADTQNVIKSGLEKLAKNQKQTELKTAAMDQKLKDTSALQARNERRSEANSKELATMKARQMPSMVAQGTVKVKPQKAQQPSPDDETFVTPPTSPPSSRSSSTAAHAAAGRVLLALHGAGMLQLAHHPHPALNLGTRAGIAATNPTRTNPYIVRGAV